MPTQIAFLGIGLMGAPMTKRLLAAGFPVNVWNRTPEKARALGESGADYAASAPAAVAGAEVVITMLQDGAAVDAVLFGQGVARALRPRTLVIDMSSIKPREAQEHARRLAELGVRYLDAPVSGGTVGAEQGTLAIMAGGEPRDFADAQPVFKPMGRATRVGPHGAGQLAKLANQMIVGITIGAVAEALQLAAKGGADPAALREAIRGGFAESRILEVHGERMVKRDFAPRGRASVHLKDFDNILDAAQSLGFQAPISALTRSLFHSLCEHGGADVDHSGLFLEIERLNEGATKVRT